jgi:hypothetical protein
VATVTVVTVVPLNPESKKKRRVGEEEREVRVLLHPQWSHGHASSQVLLLLVLTA